MVLVKSLGVAYAALSTEVDKGRGGKSSSPDKRSFEFEPSLLVAAKLPIFVRVTRWLAIYSCSLFLAVKFIKGSSCS